jgi:hypothetical protein
MSWDDPVGAPPGQQCPFNKIMEKNVPYILIRVSIDFNTHVNYKIFIFIDIPQLHAVDIYRPTSGQI